ncbi:MAG: S8 family serine peptidase [Caldilineaceae bacterium]
MSAKNVIVYFMHPDEADAIAPYLTNVERTSSFLIGQIAAADMAALEAQGHVVQVLGDAELPQSMDAALESTARGAPPPVAKGVDDLFAPAGSGYFQIELLGPLLAERRQQLTALEVELLEYIPQYQYVAHAPLQQVAAVRSLPFVRSVQPYGAAAPAPKPVAKSADLFESTRGIGDAAPATYDLRLQQQVDPAALVGWLTAQGVEIVGTGGRKVRIRLAAQSPLRAQIVNRPEVFSMEEFVPPTLHNDVARQLLGLEKANAGGALQLLTNLSGDGEIVGVADTGLDAAHADFQGRIVGLRALGRPDDASDPSGHGTHVAGSVLGSGQASGGQFHGAAPQAQLFFQSLLDADGELGGLPIHLGDLFAEAYAAGARVHNNSWGAGVHSQYTNYSLEVDEFVRDHPDMLLVISAGNEGSAASPLNAQAGYVDWLSMAAPASSKNGLTVGASRSSRTSGGLATRTWGKAWPTAFPAAPIADERTSGDPEALAAFSSRGPCDDRRIKPDLVAPGTNILSTKSAQAPAKHFWGVYAQNDHYAYMGGTSMAAPLVSGCAALVRQYYRAERGHAPSAALLKATLINGTRRLSAADALADHDALPNYHQGFGCLYMPLVIPNTQEQFRLEFVDAWADPALQLAASGDKIAFRLMVQEARPLRICLAWTDLPARALQNNLNLFVQHLPSGPKWLGNATAPSSLKIPDPDNNVEIVRLEAPAAGEYEIQIVAANLLRGPQDYALVITGDLASSLTKVN